MIRRQIVLIAALGYLPLSCKKEVHNPVVSADTPGSEPLQENLPEGTGQDFNLICRTSGAPGFGACPEVKTGNVIEQSIFNAEVARGNMWWGCTGTRIGPRHILSAAHCFSDGFDFQKAEISNAVSQYALWATPFDQQAKRVPEGYWNDCDTPAKMAISLDTYPGFTAYSTRKGLVRNDVAVFKLLPSNLSSVGVDAGIQRFLSGTTNVSYSQIARPGPGETFNVYGVAGYGRVKKGVMRSFSELTAKLSGEPPANAFMVLGGFNSEAAGGLAYGWWPFPGLSRLEHGDSGGPVFRANSIVGVHSCIFSLLSKTADNGIYGLQPTSVAMLNADFIKSQLQQPIIDSARDEVAGKFSLSTTSWTQDSKDPIVTLGGSKPKLVVAGYNLASSGTTFTLNCVQGNCVPASIALSGKISISTKPEMDLIKFALPATMKPNTVYRLAAARAFTRSDAKVEQLKYNGPRVLLGTEWAGAYQKVENGVTTYAPIWASAGGNSGIFTLPSMCSDDLKSTRQLSGDYVVTVRPTTSTFTASWSASSFLPGGNTLCRASGLAQMRYVSPCHLEGTVSGSDCLGTTGPAPITLKQKPCMTPQELAVVCSAPVGWPCGSPSFCN